MGIENVTLGQRYESFATRTGAAGQEAYQEQFVVLPDSWRALASKPNKTQADLVRLDTEYKKGFLNFGLSYINHLDKKYGNGDGQLTIDEYTKSQMAPLPKEYQNDQKFIQATHNSFHNINVNGGKTIDAKEMTALLSLFDVDVNTAGMNGKIKVYDTMAYSLNLLESPNSSRGQKMQKKITERYVSIFQK